MERQAGHVDAVHGVVDFGVAYGRSGELIAFTQADLQLVSSFGGRFEAADPHVVGIPRAGDTWQHHAHTGVILIL